MTTPTGCGPAGPARAADMQCRPGTPLMGALANVRLKMTRQTMRFLGDAGAAAGAGGRPPSAPSPAQPCAPPAEGDGRREGGGGPGAVDAQQDRVSTASSAPTSSGRRRARCRVGRAGPGRRCGLGGGKGLCCIRVRAPRVSILVQRGDHVVDRVVDSTPTTSRTTPPPKKVVTVDQNAARTPARAPKSRGADRPEPPSGPGAEITDIQARQPRTKPGAELDVERGAVTALQSGVARRPEAGDASLARRASTESLNSYVRRKASAILHQVAKNMSWFESQDAVRGAVGDQERLLRQVSRVAAYLAASRRLRQAADLYIVASVSSRAARKGAVRYCKLNCPPRQLPPPAPAPPLTPAAAPPPTRALTARLRSITAGESPSAGGTARIPIHINDLPKDLLINIFSRLDQRELSLSAAPVCRAWRGLARSRQFWRELIFDAAFHHYSAQSVCNLLRATPGLWTLELIACRDVDLVLAEVCQSCRKLRSLVVDSCAVSHRAQGRSGDFPGRRQDSAGTDSGTEPLPVLDAVLEQCVCLQYLIVAFTPHLYSPSFFSLLGRRCWCLHCFLVSAEDADVREFCESLSADAAAADAGSDGAREALVGSLTGSLTGSWTRTVPPPACPASTASDSCHTAHPPKESSGLQRRVMAVRTRNHLLRVLALRPDAELRLLQWRLAPDDKHATLDYFGVEARLTFR